jgi:lipopolysaccharide export LptBFGC system permease protein LptF
MFARLFGKVDKGAAPLTGGGPGGPGGSSAGTINALHMLQEKIEQIEKRMSLLEKRSAEEVAKARELNRAGKKAQALLALKRKKMMEGQLVDLTNHLLRLEDQKYVLEGQSTTVEQVGALAASHAVIKANQKRVNADAVERLMEDISETTDAFRQAQEALATPSGAMADMDESELLSELEGYDAEDLDAQLLQPAPLPAAAVARPVAAAPAKLPAAAAAAPAAPAAARPKPATPVKSAEELELEALEAEYA